MPGILDVVYAAITAVEITADMWFAAAVEVVMLAGSYLAYQSAKRGGQYSYSSNGYLTNTRSADEPLPVVYGRFRVGGNIVYMSSTGTDNEYLHMVITISEGPIEGIEAVYLNEKPSTDFGDKVYYEFFNGSGTQGVCATLQAADLNWNDPMRWTAYLYIRLTFDFEKFSGVPTVTVIAKGRQVYDPRNGQTAYSNNPSLVTGDFMSNKRYGLGVPTTSMGTPSFISAANWYESQTNPYTFNGVIADRQAFLDNIASILLNGRSDIFWSNGTYNLLVRKYDTPVMSFNEDEIVADSFTIAIPGLADTPNRVVIKYPDETNTGYPAWVPSSSYTANTKVIPTTANGYYYQCTDGVSSNTEPAWPKSNGSTVQDGTITWTAYSADLGWTMTDLTIEDSNAVLLYDKEERDSDITLIGTSNATQANLLGTYYLERAGINRVHSFSVHPRALALEPGDMTQITHPLPGWVDRVVRVIDIKVFQDGIVGLTVQEEDPALYDDTLNLSPHTYFQTTLPDPLAQVSGVTNVTFTEEEYFNKDVSYTRLNVTFTASTSPFWAYSEMWVDINGNGYTHYTDARGSFTIEPVEEGAVYKVKIISVSFQSIKSDFSSATEWTYTVVGKNTLPPDVQNFNAIPQADTVVLMWDAVNIVDLQGYEIRKGVYWGGGIFMGFTRAVIFQMNGVPPGTHSYMIKSVDTNGKYSTNYALVTLTVYGPASYTDKMSQPNDLTTGTFNNTQRYVDATYGTVLRVSRVNSITNYDFETDTNGWHLG